MSLALPYLVTGANASSVKHRHEYFPRLSWTNPIKALIYKSSGPLYQ